MTQLGLVFSNLSAGLQLEAFSPTAVCVCVGGGWGWVMGWGKGRERFYDLPPFRVCIIFMQLYDQFS